jgi:hypothetical protein
MALDSGTVLILITLVVLPIAAVSFALSGGAWRKVGKGAFAIEEEAPPPPRVRGGVDSAAQKAEARQMLEAKSFRRQRDGLPAIDVEAELERLLEADAEPPEPSLDAELREEVRHLVLAGNERRRRRGEPELDVDAETERQLRGFA